MGPNLEELKVLIREQVISSLDFSREISDEEMFEIIDKKLSENLRHRAVSIEEKKNLRKQVFFSIRKLDVLQALVDDPQITDVRSQATIQCNENEFPKTACFRVFLIVFFLGGLSKEMLRC